MFGTVTGDDWLSQTAAWWLPILLDAAIKGTVVLGIVALVVLRMRRASAAARHLAWTLGLASLLLLPVLSAALPAWQVLPFWLSWNQPLAHAHDSADASAEPVPSAQPAVAAQPDRFPMIGNRPPRLTAAMAGAASASPIPAVQAVPPAESEPSEAAPAAVSHAASAYAAAATLGLWLAGAIGCLLPAGIALWSLRRLRRRSDLVHDGPWPAMVHRLTADMGIRRRIAVLCSPARRMPMVWGVFRPKLLIPADAHGWSAGRLRAVLLHELEHIRRRDCLVHWMTQIVRGLYWFHPLVWIAARRITAEGERACDDAALTRGVKPSDYAEHLLHIAGGHQTRRLDALAAIAMARSSRLGSRFLAILDPDRNRRGPARRTVLLCAGALAIATTALAMVQPGPAPGAQATAQAVVAENTAGDAAPQAAKHSEGSDAEIRRAQAALRAAKMAHQQAMETNRKFAGAVTAFELRRLAFKCQEEELELERAQAKARGDKQALAKIAVRYAQAALDLARAEYEDAVERNRKTAGAVASLELRRLASQRDVAGLELERAQAAPRGDQRALAAIAVRCAQAKVDLARIEYEQAVEYNKRAPRAVTQSDLDRLKSSVKEAELELEKLKRPSRPGNSSRAGGELPLAEAIRAVNAQAAKAPESRVQKPLTEDQVVKAIEELAPGHGLSDAEYRELKRMAATRRLPENVILRQFVRYNEGTCVEHGWWVRLMLLRDDRGTFSLTIRQELLSRRPYTQKERLFQDEFRRTRTLPMLNRLVAYFDEDPQFAAVQRFSPQQADKLADAVKKAINDGKADDLLKTYHWEGVDQETRAAVSSEAEQFVKRHLSSASVSPRRFGGRLTHWQGFQTWDPNLPVLGYIALEFADRDGPKSAWLEFGEAQGQPRLVNYIVSRDDRPRLIGKPLPGRVSSHGFPLVELEDGWFESCFQFEAPDELPALRNANLEIWKIQLTPQVESPRAEKRETTRAPKGGVKTDAEPSTESSPQSGDLLSDVARRISDNYARLGGIEVTVESVHVSPGVPKRRVRIFKTAQNEGMLIEQPRSEDRRHVLLRGENFRSEPEGDERDVWVRDKDVWTQYVESSHTAWVRTTDQMPGVSTLDPREIGASNGELGFLGQLKASKVVQTKEVEAADGRRMLDVLLEKTTGRSKGMRYRASFDRSRNSLPVAVEYLTKDGKPMLTFAISYQEVLPGSAWFLRKATETYAVSGQTATTRVLGEVRHHQPIPDTAFTIEFPDGTQVRDSAHRTSFRVNGPQKPDADTLLKAGDSVPDFQFTAMDGQTYQMKGLQGKIVLIYLFSLGGGMELRFAEELWQRFKSEGLVVLAIGRDCDSAELMPFKDHLQLTLPLGGDPRREVYGRFARKGIPRLYLVGPDGKVVHQVTGHDGALSQLADRVEADLRASRDGPSR